MAKFSSYLKKKKALLIELVNELNKKYDFVSILGTDVVGTQYVCDKSSTIIRPSGISECGFVARVYKNKVYSEFSFNELKKQDIEKIINKIDCLVNNNIKTEIANTSMIKEEKLVQSFERKQVGKSYTDEEMINELKALRDYGFTLNEKIINVQTAFEVVNYSKIYISNNKQLEQFYTYDNPRCYILVKDGNNMKYAYDGFGGNNPKNELKLLKKSIEKTAKLAVELLDATLPVPGTYTIVTDASITGLIAHEAFGHGLEMDQFVKDRAKGQEYMNKPVASKILSMHDGASAAFSSGSYFFDDEGALASDTTIIDKGILVAGICDSISGSILNYKPTGNGRRESYKRKAYTRMTNTFFSTGESKFEDMIASIDYGYYICCTNNGMEDPKNWGIQCTALYGREIKNGKFTGKIISPVVMSGYVIDLLESISMVSDSMEVIGSGSCGKGYKEWVRVSDGGASIKATVKIG